MKKNIVALKSVHNVEGQTSHGVVKETKIIHEKISNNSFYIHEVEKKGMTMSENLSKRMASLEFHGVPLGTTTTDHHEKIVTSSETSTRSISSTAEVQRYFQWTGRD